MAKKKRREEEEERMRGADEYKRHRNRKKKEEEEMGLRQTLLNMPHPSVVVVAHSLTQGFANSPPFFALLNPAWLPTNQPTNQTATQKEEGMKERKKKKKGVKVLSCRIII